MRKIDLVLAALRSHGKEVSGNDKNWKACCPSHEDRSPSLSISVGNDGRVLLHCFAGCTVEQVCGAIGLKVAQLMPENGSFEKKGKSNEGWGKIVATYDYFDENGVLLYQVARFEPKKFLPRRPDGKGGWINGLGKVERTLYRLPELLANPDRIVFIVEGEKDVDNLMKLDVVATCNIGGAGKWTADYSAKLKGRHCVILSDNDDPGRDHVQQVGRHSLATAKAVQIIQLPGLPPKGDVSDWIANGGTKEDLKKLIAETPLLKADDLPEWPEVKEFDKKILPKFPTDSLPDILREWVEAESHATQTPPDLAGCLGLAVCSACIARRVVAEPRPGWREPVNLFVAILLEPGNRKSAVFSDATRPFREFEMELVEKERPEIARKQSELRQKKAKLQKLEKLAAEKDDFEARHLAYEIAAELAETPEPVLPRLLVDDATAEKVGMMLADQGGRIASMSPEGGVFDLMAGLYSKSGLPQFGVYLMGHSGDDLITDRVGRKEVRVDRPALTCAYAMQPEVIKGLAEKSAFRGRGLLARFLYSAPESWIGQREIAPDPVPESVRSSYRMLVRFLAEDQTEFVLKLDPDAENLLQAWEQNIEEMLLEGGDMEVLRDWGAKLAGATVRIASVLHCIEHGAKGLMGMKSLISAIEIAEYLIPHADAVLDLMKATEEEGTEDDAKYVWRWIERHSKTEFSKTEAQHHGKRRFPKANDIDGALGELVSRGYIREKPTQQAPSGPGRPPSPVYEVNPACLKQNVVGAPSSTVEDEDGAGSPDSGNIGSALPESEGVGENELPSVGTVGEGEVNRLARDDGWGEV